MSVQTVLLDFTVDPIRIADEIACKDLFKVVKVGLEKYFPDLKFMYDVITADGYLCVLSENNRTFVNVRFFQHGIITVNIEYFKEAGEPQQFSFDVSVCPFSLSGRDHLEHIFSNSFIKHNKYPCENLYQ